MKQTILYIDAGHGGLDPMTGEYLTPPSDGKKCQHNNGKAYHGGGWFYEGHFNRQIASEFIKEATNEGFFCLPVYEPYNNNTLIERVTFANEHYNKLKNPKSLFLSFHANAAGVGTPQTSAEGVCSFVFKMNTDTARLAFDITKALENVFTKYGSKKRSLLVYDNSLYVTRETKMPSILFELGFFDNPNNADLLINPTFRTNLVKVMIEVLKTKLA